MRRAVMFACLCALALAACGRAPGGDAATATARAAPGEAAFAEKCGMCHRAGGMGTALLARRLEGEQALLEARGDLDSGFVIQAARIGIGNMPRISRGEVSDAELAEIAAYLATPEPSP